MEIKVIASGSSGNSTMINDGITALLLDAGISFKDLQIGTGFGFSSVAGCLITHAHKDHSRACTDLAKRGIPIYSGQGTFDKIGAAGHNFRAVKAMDNFTLGTFVITAFDTVHDVPDPLGFLMKSLYNGEKVLYFVDTAYVKYKFEGLTHIIAECNHGNAELRKSVSEGIIDLELAKRITRNHLSVERLTEFLKSNNLSELKSIHLVHLSDNNSDEDRFKREVQRATGTAVFVH